MNPLTQRPLATPSLVLAALLMALLLASCAGGLVRGQPPLVGFSSVSLDQQQVRARIDIHNPNGVEMPVDVMEMSVTLGDADLGRHTTRPGIAIHPNGTEEVVFEFPVSDSAQSQLSGLESGRVNSLAYTVSGQVRAADGGSEQFTQQGYLYPVPGRPGQFRGAGPKREQSRN